MADGRPGTSAPVNRVGSVFQCPLALFRAHVASSDLSPTMGFKFESSNGSDSGGLGGMLLWWSRGISAAFFVFSRTFHSSSQLNVTFSALASALCEVFVFYAVFFRSLLWTLGSFSCLDLVPSKVLSYPRDLFER